MGLTASGMTGSRIAATCFAAGKCVKNLIERTHTTSHVTSTGEDFARRLGTSRGGGAASHG